VHIVDDRSIRVTDLLRSQRQVEALSAKEISLVLLLHLVSDAGKVPYTFVKRVLLVVRLEEGG
jgi:hypothetical protein